MRRRVLYYRFSRILFFWDRDTGVRNGAVLRISEVNSVLWERYCDVLIMLQ